MDQRLIEMLDLLGQVLQASYDYLCIENPTSLFILALLRIARQRTRERNRMVRFVIIVSCFFILSSGENLNEGKGDSWPLIEATLGTAPVQFDPDDPSIWIHPKQSNLSLIIATDKLAQFGGIFVFDLDGQIRQHIENLDRPNNVDVRYGFALNRTLTVDVAVVTERGQKQLRIYGIDPDQRRLYDLTGSNTSVFTESTGDESLPMGVALYQRPSDGKIYAIVSRKRGPRRGYLGQYELVSNGRTIDIRLVQFFGDFQGREIESIVVDDQLGYIYYSDEHFGIRKYHIDPTSGQIHQIGLINTTDVWIGDSEGLALYTTSDTDGYLIITDQVSNGSLFHIYERQGENDHVKTIRTRADKTDGIDATSHNLNERFPRGFLIVMNEGPKNFLLYDWRQIEREFDFIRNQASFKRTHWILVLLELCCIAFIVLSLVDNTTWV